VHTQEFSYHLPDRLIAQYPTEKRAASRLLQLTAEGVRHGVFGDIEQLLRAGDLLVLNDTKVIKARLLGRKDSGGNLEVLVERVCGEFEALCQVRASKPLKPDRLVWFGDCSARCLEREGPFYRLQFAQPVMRVLEDRGHVPLPPYIRRSDDAALDGRRYQTVFARTPGAVAAPTAGLHFSRGLLKRLQACGVRCAKLTLHVGAGTFQPVRGDVSDHVMHREWYAVPVETAEAVNATRGTGGRVVAVGTTVVRALESAMAVSCEPDDPAGAGSAIRPWSGETSLFIRPGYEFAAVDAMITNFHLPESTLLMLVCAFAGRKQVLDAYAAAVREEYRFFSYGDAMWLEHGCV
jgi:S-adenosylmethionine:tRNA ribosyltransferase-isomerase